MRAYYAMDRDAPPFDDDTLVTDPDGLVGEVLGQTLIPDGSPARSDESASSDWWEVHVRWADGTESHDDADVLTAHEVDDDDHATGQEQGPTNA